MTKKTEETAVAPRTPEDKMKAMINGDNFAVQVERALPSHIDAGNLLRGTWTMMQKVPKLLKCTQESVASCILSSAQFGLNIDGRDAHLIPYGDKCTLVVGFQGWGKLIMHSGFVTSFSRKEVYACDKFRMTLGLDPTLFHDPDFDHPDRNPDHLIGAYVVFNMKVGKPMFDYMSRREIDRIKSSSKAGSRGPWVDHYVEMAKKTVFLRGCKLLPISSEIMANEHPDGEDALTNRIDDPDAIEVKANEIPTSIAEATEFIAEQEHDTKAPPHCKGCGSSDSGPNGLCSKCQSEADAK